MVNRSTHYKIQGHYTNPCVKAAFQAEEERVLAKYRGQSIPIAGMLV